MATFTFDVTASSFGSWAKTEEAGRVATQQELNILAKEMAQGLRDEFAAGGHNRTGETMDSVTVVLGPMEATVSMGGGALYVEYGFPAHYIEVNQAQALHWEADDKFDEGFARPGIWVSGYEGDPFVERAMDDINYGQALFTIAEKMFEAMVRNSSGHLTWAKQEWSGDTSAEENIAARDASRAESLYGGAVQDVTGSVDTQLRSVETSTVTDLEGSL